MQRNQRLRRSIRHIPEGFHFLLEGKPHPLLIPSIIEEIVTYLPLRDLKVCRLLCKAWEQESSKNITKISKILIQDDERLVQFIKLHQNRPQEKQHNYYELRGDLDLGAQSVFKFFKLFGQQIEFIYFNKVRWVDSELKDILFNQLPNVTTIAVEARAYSDRRLFVDDHFETLPKIKVLKLNVFSFITELTTPFLRDLLRACPNLEIISSIKTEKRNPLPMQFIQYVCQQMSYDTADDVVNMPYASDIAIAEALIDAKDVVLPKLSVLDCNMRLRGHSLENLGKKTYPISQLDLTLLSDVGETVLNRVLLNLENTLKTLKLKFHPRCTAANAHQAIPPLKNLTALTLNGYRNSLKFLETVPNLKYLSLVRQNFSRAITENEIAFKFYSKLESLEVHEDLCVQTKKYIVLRVISLFPLIKRLKLENLTNGGISAVFEGYPQLEKLDAVHGLYTNEAITGIPLEQLSQLPIENYDDEEEELFQPHRVNSSVADLKELRVLSLASPHITDASVLYGVLQCQHLKNLHLISSGITDISVKRILDKLDLFYLKTEHCYKVGKDTVEYAKKKMRGRIVKINDYEGPIKQCDIPKFMRRNGSVSVKMTKIPVD